VDKPLKSATHGQCDARHPVTSIPTAGHCRLTTGTKLCYWCLIIFKCHHQTAPQYLQDLCIPVTASTSRRHLHSAARGDLQVLACRTSRCGPCSFAACAPKLCNSLPPSLRDPTLTQTLFCSRLNIHLFCLAYERALAVSPEFRRVINSLIHTCV